jgi:hypothetical protein
MRMLAGLFRRVVERLRTRDPELDALRRAVRAAIVVPLAAAVSFLVVGGSQAPLFTIIGSIWLMVLTDFPGNRQGRALAYCGLGFNGAVLITLGTVVAPIPWLAVTLMLVLGVAVTLGGVLSETIAAGQRATLLAYVLPVCTPTGPIGERLLGWAIALAVCVPAALFFLPPRHYGDLRRHAAQVCGVLADRLQGVGAASDVTHAMDALRSNFLSADFRPVGMSAGSRVLFRVVDDLEWVTDRVDENAGAALADMKEPAVKVLRCCAGVLDVTRVSERAADRAELDVALGELRSVARGRLPRRRGRRAQRACRRLGGGSRACAARSPHYRDNDRPDRPGNGFRRGGRRSPGVGARTGPAATSHRSRRPDDPGNGCRHHHHHWVCRHPVGGGAQQLAHRCGAGAGRGHHPPASSAARVLGGARRDRGVG